MCAKGGIRFMGAAEEFMSRRTGNGHWLAFAHHTGSLAMVLEDLPGLKLRPSGQGGGGATVSWRVRRCAVYHARQVGVTLAYGLQQVQLSRFARGAAFLDF